METIYATSSTQCSTCHTQGANSVSCLSSSVPGPEFGPSFVGGRGTGRGLGFSPHCTPRRAPPSVERNLGPRWWSSTPTSLEEPRTGVVRRRRLARCFENTVMSATGWLHVASISEVLRRRSVPPPNVGMTRIRFHQFTIGTWRVTPGLNTGFNGPTTDHTAYFSHWSGALTGRHLPVRP
jgi:hypothetical protein